MPLPSVISFTLSLASAVRAYDAVVCGTNGYSPPSGNISYAANAYNAVDGGFQCLSINNSVPYFESTWNWPTTQWGMGPQTSSVKSGSLDSSGLEGLDVIANVAFDMFLDANSSNAGAATTASTEIMIWIGNVGDAQPLGYSTSRTCFTQQLGRLNFVLYTGNNSRGTNVFTWVATTNETSFDEEISPLLQYLWRNSLISSGEELGLVEFGSEAYISSGNVTFFASEYSMTLEVGEAPTLTVASLPTEACTSRAPRRFTVDLYHILQCVLVVASVYIFQSI